MLAASNSRLASRATAIRRSEEVIPRSLAESNWVLSWRGTADGTAGAGELFMLLLLDDGRIVPGASPETAFDQEMVQLNKPGHRHVRRADLHSGASHRIEHPHRYYSHHAGRRLDVGNAARTTLLAVANPDTTPKERVPPIMDFHLLPDMGRMTERLRRDARLSALHRGDFSVGGLASFCGISSASVQRAPRSRVVVPGGRDPGPPEPAVTSRSRGTPHLAPPSGSSPETPLNEQEQTIRSNSSL